ncbi:MAG: cation:dicarboxylase symporter family transporter [Rectinemataceae bacterium]
MKIWMKYLMGAIFGAALALVIPLEDTGLRNALGFLFDISIRIGRYALLPLVLFSVPVAVFEQNEDKEFWKGLGRTILVLVAAVAALSVVGVVIAAVVRPARIPLVADAASAGKVPGVKDLLLAVFPESPFAALVSGQFLLPTYFLALLLGLAFSHDRSATKPVVLLFDSLSRVFYQINSFFAEFLGVLIIAATARNVLELRAAPRADVYRPLLVTVSAEALVVALIVLPAVLWFFGGKKNPYRVLYALLAPSLAALFSGDLYFPLGSLMKHAKESLGIRRRANILDIPLAAIFGRAGTALVTSTAFIVVLSSYSNLGVSPGTLFWIVVCAPFATLLMGAAPDRGTMAALMSLCALYGKGFENGFLIAAPVALPLIAIGAFLDALWAGCASILIARRAGLAQEREARFFI